MSNVLVSASRAAHLGRGALQQVVDCGEAVRGEIGVVRVVLQARQHARVARRHVCAERLLRGRARPLDLRTAPQQADRQECV